MSDMTLDGTGLGGVRVKRSLGIAGYGICFGGIVSRELRKFVNQYERFLSAMVRPVIWLFLFAVGIDALGTSIQPPYFY